MVPSDTDITGARALSQVESDVLSLGWIFRRQPELDWGIDAHAERRQDDGTASGRLIAIQVKGGHSAFSRVTQTGWYFGVSRRHASYWLNHSLPVVLVLADLQGGVCYWQHVNAATLEATRQRFKIHVPRSNQISIANATWADLADKSTSEIEDNFATYLARIPPSTREALEIVGGQDRPLAAALASALAKPDDPRTAVLEVLSSRHEAIASAGVAGWQVMASYCSEHDLGSLAADAHEEIASLDSARAGRELAKAAIRVSNADVARARHLVERASELAEADELTIVAHALVDEGFADDIAVQLASSDGAAALAFSGNRAVMQRRPGAAIDKFEQLLELDPDASAVRMQLARAYHLRSQSSDASADDLIRALEQGRQALKERREWSAQTADALEIVVRSLGALGRLSEALQSCEPAPSGSATAEEGADDEIVRLGFATAEMLGDRVAMSRVAGRSANARLSRLLSARAELPANSDEAWIEHFNERFESASDNLEEAATAAMQLAQRGVDRSEDLAALPDAFQLSPAYVRLVSAVARSMSDPNGALIELRALADDELVAAQRVIAIVEANQGVADAIVVARQYEVRFSSQVLAKELVKLLMRADDTEGARAEIESRLSSGHVHGIVEAEFRLVLGEILASRSDWLRASEQFDLVAQQHDLHFERAAWNLAVCLSHLNDWPGARRTLDEFDLHPATADEVAIWAQVHSMTGWRDETAAEAVQLALAPETSAELATSLLGSVLLHTRGTEANTDEVEPPDDQRPAVAGTIHAEAFEAINELIERHGEDFGIRRLEVSTEGLIDQLQELLAPTTQPPVEDLVRQVRRGQIPLGLLTSIRGDPYAYLLSARLAGVSAASDADPNAHAAEELVAMSALDGVVVVDLSAVSIAATIDQWDVLRAHFNVLEVPMSGQLDAAAGVLAARSATATAGSMYVDAVGNVRMTTPDPAASLAALQRAERLSAAVNEVSGVDTANLDDSIEDLSDLKPAVWVDPIELARHRGVPLWSDDLAQRRLALHLGIQTFGTEALIDVIRSRALELDSSEEALQRFAEGQRQLALTLVRQFIVDVPIGADDLKDLLAADDDPSLFAGLAVISRAGWWRGRAIQEWSDLLRSVGAVRPASIDVVFGAGLTGAAEESIAMPGRAARQLAILALLGRSDVVTVESARAAFEAAKAVSSNLGLPNPQEQIVWASAYLRRAGFGDGAVDDVVQQLIAEWGAEP